MRLEEIPTIGVPLPTFHKRCGRQAYWPSSLSATSTHDTKRSEERGRASRAFRNTTEWKAHATRWTKFNKKHTADWRQLVPDRNEAYLLYQTLVGIWPLTSLDDAQYRVFCDRIQEYMSKALKEAKVYHWSIRT